MPVTLSDRQDCFSLVQNSDKRIITAAKNLRPLKNRSLEERREKSCFFLPHPFPQTRKPFPRQERLHWALPLTHHLSYLSCQVVN